MPAARIVQFDCPACGDLIELHGVDKEYIDTMIKDMAADKAKGRHSGPCAYEALKFALVAHLDNNNGNLMTVMETHVRGEAAQQVLEILP